MVRFALTFLLCASPAYAFKLKQDSTGSNVKWGQDVSFLVDAKLNERLDAPHALEAVQAAVATLDGATPGLQVTLTTGTTQGVGYDLTGGSTNHNEIVVPETWAFEKNSIAVAVLTIDSKTHRILDADIAFNRVHRKFGVLMSHQPGVGEYDDIQNAVTHELGHALGLAHNDEDTDVVMYPGARRGEINKRTLTADDEAALLELYAQSAPQEVGVETSALQSGCSASPGNRGGLASVLVLLFALSLRGRRTLAPARIRARARLLPLLAVGALGLPAVGTASPLDRAQAQVRTASLVVTGEVIAKRTRVPKPGEKLLMTELQLSVRECLKGRCPESMVVLVPGGRQGDIEQVVEGFSVPETGEVVGVTVEGSTSQQTPSAKQTAVYKLGQMRDFAAFATGLHAARIQTRLTLPR